MDDAEAGEFPLLRRLVAAVAGLAVAAAVLSVAIGPAAGKRLGYQLMTAHSAGLSWLLICVVLTITGVPLVTFVLREQLYMWDKWKMRFEPLDRDERPITWWLMLWVDLALFVVLLGMLFVVRISR
ncbi:MAG: hypothetical protein AB7O31_00070 [Burkholderiales bacterium]